MQQGIRRRNICMRKRGLGIGISHSSINKRVQDKRVVVAFQFEYHHLG
jgi:hypothetical protein